VCRVRACIDCVYVGTCKCHKLHFLCIVSLSTHAHVVVSLTPAPSDPNAFTTNQFAGVGSTGAMAYATGSDVGTQPYVGVAAAPGRRSRARVCVCARV
jgi:hypothetical protein